MSVADNVGAICHDCIFCDECGASSPPKSCARCLSAYYCGRDCQVSHWKQHKQACSFLVKNREMWKDHSKTVLPNENGIDTTEVCAVCLEEVVKPISLDCGHTFCQKCLCDYEYKAMESERMACCPLCRGKMPFMAERSMERSNLYHRRANSSGTGSPEQKKYGALALAEMELIESHRLYDEIHETPQFLFMKAKIALLACDADATINTANKILSTNDDHPEDSRISRSELFAVKLWLAQSYLEKQQWADALSLHLSLYYDKGRSTYVLPHVKGTGTTLSGPILRGISRSYYEMGKYNDAISWGNKVIKLWRHTPGAHRYVALAQRAKGDIDAAKRTISRAILYEYHWNEENLQENRELLKELNIE